MYLYRSLHIKINLALLREAKSDEDKNSFKENMIFLHVFTTV